MQPIPMGNVPAWHAERKPGVPAVICGSKAVTWAELAAAVSARAASLRKQGLQANDIVAICQPNSIDLVANAFAVWSAGGTVFPLSTSLAASEVAELVALAHPTFAIGVANNLLGNERNLPAQWQPEKSETEIEAHASEAPAKHWKIMASGGSTGRPKLIVAGQPALTDPSSYELFPWDLHKGRLGRTDGTMLCPGPLYHNGPFVHAFMNLFAGSTLVLMDRFDAAGAVQLIAKHEVEFAYLVPTMMRRIFALAQSERALSNLSSLRGIIHTAAACPTDLKREWIDWLGPERVWETYGSTEAVAATLISGGEWLERPGSVGRFFFGSEGEIRDAEGEPVPTGEVGEIWVKPGPRTPPFEYVGGHATERDGWYAFGDLGHMDDEGYLYISDRRSDLIIRGGINIFPAEVEAAIEAYDGVQAAAVIGSPDADLGERVHAIVQTELDLETSEILAFLGERLSRYKTPQSFEFTRSELRDASGKLRRSALRDKHIASMSISG